MGRQKEQILYVIGAAILLAVLYFGFDTKPSSQKALEKSRAITGKSFDIPSLTAEAKKALNPEDAAYLASLESRLIALQVDTSKLAVLKDLSGFWYAHQQEILAGTYARNVAEISGDAESWSIAGTTFASVLQKESVDAATKEIARDQAIEAFENAISLEPQNISHRVNQALCYVEAPDQAQPMKGIQMLSALATNFPQSALPPYHLARLAMRTGQMERAEERIGQALEIDSTNGRIHCLAAEIYSANNKSAEAQHHAERCAEKN